MASLPEFEWDAGKNIVNVRKHGIDFADAVHVFSDPASISFASKIRSEEARRLIVGKVSGIFMTVVYTVRGERIRIISARHSRIAERKRYGE